MKLIDSIILFSGLAFLVMWVDQFVYKGVSMKDSYFFLMFGLGIFLIYVYRRGLRKMNEQREEENNKIKPKSKKKTK